MYGIRGRTTKWMAGGALMGLLLARAGITAGELDPGPGEIHLQGVIRAVDAAEKSFVLEASSFTLPNGSTRSLSQPRPKTIEVGDAAIYLRRERSRTVELGELKPGFRALVVGKDLGTGKSLPAREVAVWERIVNGRYALGPAGKPANPRPAPAPAAIPAAAEPAAPRSTGANGDWPQWRGPERNGLSRETGLLDSWPQGGPRLAWRAPGLGGGYSTPTVAAGRIYGMGYRGETETVWCLDAATGRSVWVASIARANRGVGYGEGSRCSPTVDGDRVYALGVSGDLVCLDTARGTVRWQRSLVREFGGRIPDWGYSESPLVDGDRVVACPGGGNATIVAFDKMTGRDLWRSRVPEGDMAQYASAIVAEVAGQRQYIQFMRGGVIGVSARDGRFLWRWNRPANGTANCSTPIFSKGFVFAASGYNTGGGLAQLVPNGGGFSAREVYFTRDMKNHHGGMVLVGEHLYGCDESILTCLDIRTGRTAWQERSVGKGSVTYADGHLYIRGEGGAIALVEANPQRYVEKGRFSQPERSSKPSWPHPVVAGGKLLIRDQETLLCYDVIGK